MDFEVTADHLRGMAKEFVYSYPSETNIRNWWRKPLLATAQADERFKVLPKIASDEHILPRELLPSAKTVIVFFIPFIKKLIDENSAGKFPCRNWGLAYEGTNVLIGILSERIKDYLTDQGYNSVLTPVTHNFDSIKLVAKWSHKHLAHLSGLGRFGVNTQLITPSGCAGRLGSLVTEADLGDNSLVESQELCLHKAGKECLKCLERCPVGALKEDGIDRHRCYYRLKFNLNHTEAFAGLGDTTHVCGKCVVNLPCSFDPTPFSTAQKLGHLLDRLPQTPY
jgi:epoxyqueuosine reductase QueG